MHLMRRVRRIERAIAPSGGCRVCHGEGPPAPHVLVNEGEPVPEPPVCPGCGRGPGPYRVVILMNGPAEQL